jgi:hypothetical protein
MALDGDKGLEYWEVWYPKAAATGLLLGRGQIDPAGELLLHAGPDVLTVEVSDQHGNRLAFGQDLPKTTDSPICRLHRRGERVEREDIWPTEADYGKPVLLPGGEVGILKSWWNAGDRQEWRWQVEFYNSLR